MKKFLVISIFLSLSILFCKAQEYSFSGGDGSFENPFLITTAQDIVTLSEFVMNDTNDIKSAFNKKNTYEKFFTLTNDIDMSGVKFLPIGGWVNDTICDDYRLFAGTFYGNNKKISNITFEFDTLHNYDFIGLFGLVIGGGIYDLNIENITFKLNNKCSQVGGIVGHLSGKLYNSSAKVSIINGINYIGGLVGLNSNKGYIEKCNSTGKMNLAENSNKIGGLIGQNAGEVNNSFSVCMVDTKDNCIDVSGFIGSNSGIVKECFSSGIVTVGENCQYVGNFVGNNFFKAKITDSYSVGRVSSKANALNIGGFAGYNTKNCSIEKCYSNSTLLVGDDNSFIGSFVASNSGLINNCYTTGIVMSGERTIFMGGFTALNKGKITNSYSISEVHYPESCSEIEGFISQNESEIINCFTAKNQSDISGITSNADNKIITAIKLNDKQEEGPWIDDTKNYNNGFPIFGFSRQTVGIKDIQNKDIEIVLFPNPAHDYINIDIKTDNKIVFQLFDMQGKILLNKNILPNESINISNLNKGMYFYNVVIGGNKTSGKLVKL